MINRESLIKLLNDALINGCHHTQCERCKYNNRSLPRCRLELFADYLIEAGVVNGKE